MRFGALPHEPARMTRLLPVSAIYDVMKSRGIDRCILPADIRGLAASHRVYGRAFTIEGREDTGLTRHESLLRWSELLSKIPAGTVAVCQPNTRAIALMGELSAHALAVKGVRGYVVDGGCRDGELVDRSGLAVFCTHLTPRDIVARWTWHSLEQPIVIGEVKVSSGDLIVGDRDGVIVVPGVIADEIVAEAATIVGTESDMRKAIIAGTDPKQAYLLHGKF
jgi:4-hydroxy-4-methyl-2-oxoglutarate aldolase